MKLKITKDQAQIIYMAVLFYQNEERAEEDKHEHKNQWSEAEDFDIDKVLNEVESKLYNKISKQSKFHFSMLARAVEFNPDYKECVNISTPDAEKMVKLYFAWCHADNLYDEGLTRLAWLGMEAELNPDLSKKVLSVEIKQMLDDGGTLESMATNVINTILGR